MIFQYTIKGIIITEEEAKEISREYNLFCIARRIDNTLQLDNLKLAHQIAMHYYESDDGFSCDLWEAIDEYRNEIIEEYLLSHNLATEQEIANMEDEQAPMFILENKTNMNVETGENLCEELMILYQLKQKYKNRRN